MTSKGKLNGIARLANVVGVLAIVLVMLLSVTITPTLALNHTLDGVSGTINAQSGSIDPFSGTINLQSGTISAQSGTLNAQSGTISAQSGTLNVQSGTLTTESGTINTQSGSVAYDSGTPNAQSGTINAQSGTLNAQSGTLCIQSGTINAQSGTLCIQSGTLNAQSGTINLQSGTINAQSGTLNAQSNTIEGFSGTISAQSGTISVQSGTINIQYGDTINVISGTISIQSGTINAQSGTISVQSGTLYIDSGTINAQSGTFTILSGTINMQSGTINIQSGTISVQSGAMTAADSTVIVKSGTINAQSGTLNVQSGTINAQSGTLNAQSGTIDRFSGTISVQSGQLTLSGTTTGFSGTINVQSGTINMQSGWGIDAQSGTVNMQSGTISVQSGTISAQSGTLSVQSGSTIAFSSGTVNMQSGTLNVQSGTLNAQSGTISAQSGTLSVQSGTLSVQSGTISAQSGILILTSTSGTLNAQSGTINMQSGTLNAQSGKITEFSGTINVQSGTLKDISGVPTSYSGTLNVQSGTINMQSGTLNAQSGAIDGFSGTLCIQSGTLSTQSGVVAILGGTIILQSGTINAQSGTISVQSGAASMASGTLSVQSGTLNAQSGILTLLSGTINAQSGTLNAQSGVIEGFSGTISVQSGTISTQSGTISMQSGDAINVASGTINLQSYTYNAQSGTISIQSGTINVQSGTISAQSAVNVGLGGTINIQSGTLNVQSGTLSMQSGTLNVQSGTISAQSGTVKADTGETVTILSGTINMQSGSVNMQAGVIDRFTGTISVQSGTISLQSGGTTEFSGTINVQSGTLNMQSGTLNTQSGTISVQSGTLNVQSGKIIGGPSGTLNAQSGAISMQSGTISTQSGTINAQSGCFAADPDSLAADAGVGQQGKWFNLAFLDEPVAPTIEGNVSIDFVPNQNNFNIETSLYRAKAAEGRIRLNQPGGYVDFPMQITQLDYNNVSYYYNYDRIPDILVKGKFTLPTPLTASDLNPDDWRNQYVDDFLVDHGEFHMVLVGAGNDYDNGNNYEVYGRIYFYGMYNGEDKVLITDFMNQLDFNVPGLGDTCHNATQSDQCHTDPTTFNDAKYFHIEGDWYCYPGAYFMGWRDPKLWSYGDMTIPSGTAGSVTFGYSTDYAYMPWLAQQYKILETGKTWTVPREQYSNLVTTKDNKITVLRSDLPAMAGVYTGEVASYLNDGYVGINGYSHFQIVVSGEIDTIDINLLSMNDVHTAEMQTIFTPQLTPVTCEWDWGDGTVNTIDVQANVGSVVDSHTYEQAGEYPVKVTLYDSANNVIAMKSYCKPMGSATYPWYQNEPTQYQQDMGVKGVRPITVSQFENYVILRSYFTDIDAPGIYAAKVFWGDGTSAPCGMYGYNNKLVYLDSSGNAQQNAISGLARGGHIYTTPGEYNVRLVIYKNDGTEFASADTKVNIEKIHFWPANTEYNGQLGDGRYIPGVYYTIDWGDQTALVKEDYLGGRITKTHTYTKGGLFTVTVTFWQSWSPKDRKIASWKYDTLGVIGKGVRISVNNADIVSDGVAQGSRDVSMGDTYKMSVDFATSYTSGHVLSVNYYWGETVQSSDVTPDAYGVVHCEDFYTYKAPGKYMPSVELVLDAKYVIGFGTSDPIDVRCRPGPLEASGGSGTVTASATLPFVSKVIGTYGSDWAAEWYLEDMVSGEMIGPVRSTVANPSEVTGVGITFSQNVVSGKDYGVWLKLVKLVPQTNIKEVISSEVYYYVTA